MERVHLLLIVQIVLVTLAVRTTLSSDKTALDLQVHLGNHGLQLPDEFIVVAAFKRLPLRIVLKGVHQVIVVSFLARPDVCLGVWEQVIRTEAEQVELTDARIVKVVSLCQSYE